MKQKLAAPLSCLIATAVVVFHLTQFGIKWGYTFNNMLRYLFVFDKKLDAGMAVQALFSAILLWMIVFSIFWFIFSFASKEQKKITSANTNENKVN